MKRGEHVDRAGWTWSLYELRDYRYPEEPGDWLGQLDDGPFAGLGEEVRAETALEVVLAIEERVRLLLEIQAEREAGL